LPLGVILIAGRLFYALRAGAKQLNKVSTLAELKPVILGIA